MKKTKESIILSKAYQILMGINKYTVEYNASEMRCILLEDVSACKPISNFAKCIDYLKMNGIEIILKDKEKHNA